MTDPALTPATAQQLLEHAQSLGLSFGAAGLEALNRADTNGNGVIGDTDEERAAVRDVVERAVRGVVEQAVGTVVPGHSPQGTNAGLQAPGGLSMRDRITGGGEQSEAPTVGRQLVELRNHLRRADPQIMEGVIAALNDPNFVRFVLANPEVLERAGAGDTAAIAQLASHLPAGPLQSLLATGSAVGGIIDAIPGGSILTSALGSAAAQASGFGPAAQLLAQALRDPLVNSALTVALDSGIKIGDLVRDVRDGKFPLLPLARIADGQGTGADVVAVLRDLRDRAGGRLTLDGTDPAVRQLLDHVVPSYINAGAVREITVGPGDQVKVRFDGDAITLADGTGYGAGREITMSFDELAKGGEGMRIEGEFGDAFEALFVDWKPTGNDIIDIIIKILLAPFLLLAALFMELFGTEARLERQEDGKLHLIGSSMGIDSDQGEVMERQPPATPGVPPRVDLPLFTDEPQAEPHAEPEAQSEAQAQP